MSIFNSHHYGSSHSLQVKEYKRRATANRSDEGMVGCHLTSSSRAGAENVYIHCHWKKSKDKRRSIIKHTHYSTGSIAILFPIFHSRVMCIACETRTRSVSLHSVRSDHSRMQCGFIFYISLACNAMKESNSEAKQSKLRFSSFRVTGPHMWDLRFEMWH